jgi:hypothetical protein
MSPPPPSENGILRFPDSPCSCDSVQAALDAYLDGELMPPVIPVLGTAEPLVGVSPLGSAAVHPMVRCIREHVAKCVRCRAEEQHRKAVRWMLRRHARRAEEDAPRSLKARVRAQLDAAPGSSAAPSNRRV